MTTLASLTVKLIGDISDFEEKMSSASSRLRSAGESMARSGAVMTAGVTLPLVGIGVAAVNAAASFESSLNMMQAVSGATASEMAQVSDVAMALGADLTLPGTSASDAAEAMTELSRAGLSVQESMDAARGVLELSAAAEISNADAATIVANALNSFGLAGTEAGRVANLLAGGANASSASITDMAAGLQMSSAVAASMGVPIEDLTTSIAAMANAGIAGSDAGTSLKTMLMRLGAPTDKAAGLMQQLGINIFDAQGQMLPMRSIIEQFSTSMAGMTMEQRNAALATIFGTDAIRAANIVLLGGATAFDTMKDAVTREGAAHDLASAKMSGFSGALEGLRSTMETVLLTVGTPFLQMLTGIVQQGAAVIGRIAEMDPRLIQLGVGFAALLAAIGPVVTIMGGVVTALGLVLSPIGLVVAAIVGLAVIVVQHFGGIEQTITAVTTTVRTIMTALSGFFQENGAQITGWVDQAWQRVQAIIDGVVTAVSAIVRAIFGAVATFMQSHGEEIKAFMLEAWTRIGEIVDLALQLIQATVIPALQAVARFIDEHGAEIQAIMSAVWTAIKTVIDVTLTLIKGILQAALAIIRGDWSGALEILRNTAETIWNRIKDVIQTILTAIAAFIETKWAEIKTGIADKLNEIRSNVETRWTEIKSGIANRLTEIRDNLTQRMVDMVNAVRDKLAEMKRWFEDKLEEIRSFIENFDLRDVGRALIEGLIDGVRSMAQALIDAAVGVVQDAIDAAKALLGISSPSRLFRGIGEDMMAGLVIGIRAGGGPVADSLHDLLELLTEIGSDFPQELGGIFDSLGGIGDTIRVLLAGPGGDLAPLVGAWKDQLVNVFEIVIQTANAVTEPGRMAELAEFAGQLRNMFDMFKTAGEAMATLMAGPGGNLRPLIGSWKDQMINMYEIIIQVYNAVTERPLIPLLAQFAQNLATAFELFKVAAEAIAAVVAAPDDLRDQMGVWVDGLLEMIADLALLAQTIGVQGVVTAQGIFLSLQTIAEYLRDGILLFGNLGGLAAIIAEIAAFIEQYLQTMLTGLEQGIQGIVPLATDLWGVLGTSIGSLGFDVGIAWAGTFLQGLESGWPDVQDFANTLITAPPGGTLESPGGPPTRGGDTININGPFYIREDADIMRLAEEISRILGGQAQQNRRMNVGWSA